MREPRPRDRGRRRYPPELMLGLAVIGIGCALLVADRLPDLPGAGAPDAARSPAADGAATPAQSPPPSASPSSSPSSPSGGDSPIMGSVVEEVDSADGGIEVVGGGTEKAGDGPLHRYTVEVEAGLPGDPEDFATAVEVILSDERGWAGELSFQRVDSGPSDFTVTLASPDTVDALCAPLRTNGYTSCTTGGRAVINQNRWVSGVDLFEGDLKTYRIYVISHEVGHTLGHGHVGCPGAGEPAPVMQQQTLFLDGCEPNGWRAP